MCQPNTGPPTGRDEYYIFSRHVNEFIRHVNTVRARESDGSEIVAAIEPAFTRLLAVPDLLPEMFRQPKEDSGMGSGIGMWLLYRSGDGGLAFSALVVPPGASTPVHDHLAWGIVGLYQGEQDETVFTRTDDGADEERATLDTMVRRSLKPGDMYELLPETDIHRVTTISNVTSVSLHLLGNDNGCIWRHQFNPEESSVKPFKSGWLNVPCYLEAAAGV